LSRLSAPHTPLPPPSPYTTLFRSYGHSTVIRTAEVVIAFLESVTLAVINVLSIISINPAPKHLALVIESILLAVDSLKGYIIVRSEEHRLNSSHVSISYAVFCLKK